MNYYYNILTDITTVLRWKSRSMPGTHALSVARFVMQCIALTAGPNLNWLFLSTKYCMGDNRTP